MSAATGRPSQGHLVYAVNQGAWWIFYLTSTQSLSAAYCTSATQSSATWTAPTGSPYSLYLAHQSYGRSFAFGYANISSKDVLHMESQYPGETGSSETGPLYHSRFTLGTTWSNTLSENYEGGYLTVDGGVSAAVSLANVPTNTIATNSSYAMTYANTDSGTSWTYSSPSYTNINSPSNAPAMAAVVPMSSSNTLYLAGNGSASGKFTQVIARLNTGGTTGNVFGSSVTQCDANAFGTTMRTSSDVHAMALSDNSSSYSHARYNGSSWSSGSTVGSLTYGTNSGISLVSDGTSVWAAAIDSSSNIQYNQWTSGGGWGGWTVLEATRSNTPAYITGCYSAANSQIMWAWTEYTGSNYNIIGSVLSTAASLHTSLKRHFPRSLQPS